MVKRATNVSIDAELLQKAKAMKINLSQTLEQGLEVLVRKKNEQQWLEENREAIEDYNRRIKKQGLLSDKLGRRF